VEKIQVIHSSAGVYYYYYSFFLSKLTKKGKTGRRDTSALCLQKKKYLMPSWQAQAQVLPDCRFVCRKNETPLPPAEQ
jgi:hypothetical protein